MGAAVGPKSGGAKSDINVTPLIDIVLVLLIVFIVMVPGLTKAQKVVVPQVVVTNAPPPKSNQSVVVTIDKDGKYFLQQDEVPLAELSTKLVPVIKLQPYGERKVVLKIEEDLPFQYAVNALDTIRVASDQARKETLEGAGAGMQDGGDTKVAVAVKKKDQ
ncbi:MAG TPA: biopolymer transporter ExbD [Holophagaceae bacterium]|nr:biopolymer transporter ExbD [Holophagaceae bacterium]